MPTNEITIVPYSLTDLKARLGDDQGVEYLHSYLTDLKVKTIVTEQHYVDRHYLDDFANYYARSFNTPPSYCARLHFFEGITCNEVDQRFEESAESEISLVKAEESLQERYLGFVVSRPLMGARLGRTVLKTYPVDGRRRYDVVRPYVVNLGAMKLVVRGLAFQQQDGGAAVCASTALWSALQRVAFVAGHRTATPYAITAAAKSPYPASAGLTDVGMAAALSSLGYIADYFTPAENRSWFRAMVKSCLESQLPVVLLLSKKHETGAGEVTLGHAVTITGFSEPTSVIAVPTPHKKVAPINLQGGSLEVIYVHDDNLGSHAHYELFDISEKNTDGHEKLMLRRGRSGKTALSWWLIDEWAVEGALVPKPDNLRLPIDSLFSILVWFRRELELVFPSLELHFAPHFVTGVEYKRRLVSSGLDRKRLRSFLSDLSLPRHVGALAVYAGSTFLCDVLIDVSEVERDRTSPAVIAFVAHGVPKNSVAAINLESVANYFQASVITAP